MEISKKDLLKETGISYGQLYRWKREGLIPEAWFVKKSSPTGQETFFPRELVINRITAIQKLKDKYSLEQLASLLSPEVSNRIFSEEDLEYFTELDINVAAEFMDALEKDTFTFIEIMIMMGFSDWKAREIVDTDTLSTLISGIAKTATTITSVEYQLLLLRIEDEYYTIFNADPTGKDTLYFDKRIELIERIHLQELSNTMKLKYKDTFSFTFDEDVTRK